MWSIQIDFTRGFVLGLEYLDGFEPGEPGDTEFAVVLHLGIIRLLFWKHVQ